MLSIENQDLITLFKYFWFEPIIIFSIIIFLFYKAIKKEIFNSNDILLLVSLIELTLFIPWLVYLTNGKWFKYFCRSPIANELSIEIIIVLLISFLLSTCIILLILLIQFQREKRFPLITLFLIYIDTFMFLCDVHLIINTGMPPFI